MKSKKRVITVVVLALAGVALIAVPTAAFRGHAGGMGMRKGMRMGPAFTDEQLEKIEKIHDRYNDERAGLTNRLKVIMLEAHDAVADDTPDFDAIERRIDEMFEVKGDLAKLRLRIHKEIRPLLDDDQKVLFDRGLARMLHGGMAGGRDGHPGMMGRGGMRGDMPGGMGGPGGGRPGMRGGMGGGMPDRGAMGGGMAYQMMPWYADTDTDLDE